MNYVTERERREERALRAYPTMLALLKDVERAMTNSLNFNDPRKDPHEVLVQVRDFLESLGELS